ncbi:MAG TPA: RHS repeat-associated core domain-containing protein, partial [Thermoanaerobaculia bacterium]|nr:RHS repeat-associated core domain-containing protein [Thermoanaerobaculia bacterium]
SPDPAWSLTSIAYDANGNFTTIETPSGSTVYSYASGTNRLTEAGSTALTYDASGNVLTEGDRSFTYDPVTGLATSVSIAGGAAATLQLTYGAYNERLLKSLDGTATQTLYVRSATSATLVEWVTAGDAAPVSVSYVYGADGLVAVVSDQTYFVISDHQGSTRLVVDGTGAVAAGYDYLPFGALAQQYGPLAGNFHYLYSGQELDRETGLYALKVRLYDPAIGRFLQPDPAFQYANPYVYTGDDPVMYVDPSGQVSLFGEIMIDIAMAALAISAIMVTVLSAGAALPAVAAVAIGVIGGAVGGLGVSGFVYGVTTKPQNFSGRAFGLQLAYGTISGAITGGFSAGAGALVADGATAASNAISAGVRVGDTVAADSGAGVGAAAGEATPLLAAGGETAAGSAGSAAGAAASSGLSAGAKLAIVLGANAIGGAAGNVAGTLTENAVDHKPLGSRLAAAAIGGAITGLIGAGVGEGLGHMGLTPGVFDAPETALQKTIQEITPAVGVSSILLFSVNVESTDIQDMF